MRVCVCLCCYQEQCQVIVQSVEQGLATEKTGSGEHFCSWAKGTEGQGGGSESLCCCDSPRNYLGKGDLRRKVVTANLAAQCTWLTAKVWKEKINTFCFSSVLHPLYSVTHQAGWRPTESMPRKLLEAGPDVHGGLCRAELGALCRLGSSMINAGDTHMAVKPQGCCQAARRK